MLTQWRIQPDPISAQDILHIQAFQGNASKHILAPWESISTAFFLKPNFPILSLQIFGLHCQSPQQPISQAGCKKKRDHIF